jgi:hypothetical protein
VTGSVGHAHCAAQALAERARGHVDEVEARRGVTLERVAQLAQVLEVRDGEEAGLCPSRVEDRRRMTL